MTISAGTHDAADLTTILADGGITSVDASAATTLTGSVTEINAVLTEVNITDPTTMTATVDAGTEAASDLTALLAEANVTSVSAAAVTTLTGTATEVLAVLNEANITDPTAATVTVDAGTEAAADLSTILADAGITSVDASAVTTLTGSASAVREAVNTITLDGDYLVTLGAGTAASADLNTVDADTTGAIDATAATTITGTAADVITAIQSTGITTATDYNVTLSGAATVGQLTTIDGDTTGAISAAAITDTFSAINTLALNSATTLQNATGPITANGNFADNSMDMTDVGNLADLVINGGGGNDTIIGAQGNDTITGGTGNDILFGGLGTDTFVIADIENNGSDQFFTFTTNGDNANVNQGTDVLQFSDADLTGVASFVAYTGGGAGLALTLNDGATDVELVSGANAQASGAEAAFLFDTSTGVLSFDADGSGAGAVINVGTFYSDSGSTLITDILAADFNFIA